MQPGALDRERLEASQYQGRGDRRDVHQQGGDRVRVTKELSGHGVPLVVKVHNIRFGGMHGVKEIVSVMNWIH